MFFSKGRNVAAFVIILVIIDQLIKIAVKTSMMPGESFNVLGSWFRINFIENNGMALGIQWGDYTGKILLTSFRIVLISALIWYLNCRLIARKAPTGVIVGVSLILVGAIGNAIDCIFYEMIFGAVDPVTGAIMHRPFMGKVVDMFYFPIIETERLVFFQYIFNFADACISCSVVYLILFQRKFFSNSNTEKA
ncbi:MAG: signal peptidase II [Bacteroidales bacterium]|nr:signal peptidase II [Bacteroidales bacterium]